MIEVRPCHSTGRTVLTQKEVERKVKAVVQVAGLHSLVRIDVNNDSRREWFRNVGSDRTWRHADYADQ